MNAPLSVSIASLVALVVSTLKCVNIYVSGVAGEKSSVVALLHEVDTLQSILSTLDELLRSHSAKGVSFAKTSALTLCISACEHKLKSPSKKLDQIGDAVTLVLLWRFSEKEHLRAINLQRISQCLQFAFSINGSSLFSRNSGDLLRV